MQAISDSSKVTDLAALNELMAMADLRADSFERALVGSLKASLEMRASFRK